MPQATFTFETTLTRIEAANRPEREIGCEVEYRVRPAIRATAITPAEPESIEIVNVKTDGGVELTAWEYDELQSEAEADAVDAIAEAREEAAEARRMERRIAA